MTRDMGNVQFNGTVSFDSTAQGIGQAGAEDFTTYLVSTGRVDIALGKAGFQWGMAWITHSTASPTGNNGVLITFTTDNEEAVSAVHYAAVYSKIIGDSRISGAIFGSTGYITNAIIVNDELQISFAGGGGQLYGSITWLVFQ